MSAFSLQSGDQEFAWWVDGAGQAALFLHGFTGCKENWIGLASKLVRWRRVMALDLPGHGMSSAPAEVDKYTMAQVGEHLVRMLDHLQIDRVDLVGYSMGGRLSLYFALCHPRRVRSLVLESASPGLLTEEERLLRRRSDDALADRIERDGIDAFVQEWERQPLFNSQRGLDEATQLALRTQRLNNKSQGLANSLRGMGSGVQPELWSRLGELSVPVMLVAGALDEKFVALNQRMAAMIPQARLKIVPEAGHAVHLESPGCFESLLRDFWEVGSQ